MEGHGRHCKSWKYIIGNVIVYRDVYCEGFVSRARLASNFPFARNQSRIGAKRGNHFQQADLNEAGWLPVSRRFAHNLTISIPSIPILGHRVIIASFLPAGLS